MTIRVRPLFLASALVLPTAAVGDDPIVLDPKVWSLGPGNYRPAPDLEPLTGIPRSVPADPGDTHDREIVRNRFSTDEEDLTPVFAVATPPELTVYVGAPAECRYPEKWDASPGTDYTRKLPPLRAVYVYAYNGKNEFIQPWLAVTEKQSGDPQSQPQTTYRNRLNYRFLGPHLSGVSFAPAIPRWDRGDEPRDGMAWIPQALQPGRWGVDIVVAKGSAKQGSPPDGEKLAAQGDAAARTSVIINAVDGDLPPTSMKFKFSPRARVTPMMAGFTLITLAGPLAAGTEPEKSRVFLKALPIINDYREGKDDRGRSICENVERYSLDRVHWSIVNEKQSDPLIDIEAVSPSGDTVVLRALKEFKDAKNTTATVTATAGTASYTFRVEIDDPSRLPN